MALLMHSFRFGNRKLHSTSISGCRPQLISERTLQNVDTGFQARVAEQRSALAPFYTVTAISASPFSDSPYGAFATPRSVMIAVT